MSSRLYASSNTQPTHVPKNAFLDECVRVEIINIMPLKISRPSVKESLKYQQILASIQDVGLVEPPVVIPVPGQTGHYFLLDGHLRIEALKDLDELEVDCLVATDDDTYSYNKRTNRLSAVHSNKMIVRAMERGVSAERLGKALGLSQQTIKQRFRLLNGICAEVISLLGDTDCPANVFNLLRQMKPLRQIEAAELMIGNRNLSVLLAKALLAATPSDQLVFTRKPLPDQQISPESIARLERELAALQMQIKTIEDDYGPDVLHLTVIKGYLTKLLANASVVRWLARHQPEYLKEFQSIAELAELPWGNDEAGPVPKPTPDQ
ncbi:plasmid partitioning protein RepB C-terminal domain-containing protein [Pseudomonas baltica]|uniref:ParB N-terminal domain-containing protein n=1 Tax=Pseudomonas baltica TaxID=2762576 RepID=A0A7X1G707_9PSED|nr:plasmid partitioning protein RepB C-terminal domain-containing protein [Pseudomonas baltica]MBC2679632.1 ParB N-terminal domain-containing protein [Pseudomonas baltica]